MVEEEEDILYGLPERVTMRLTSLEKSDEYIEDVVKTFHSEKEEFTKTFGEELTERYESRIDEVCIDLAILKRKLEEKMEE